MIKEIQKKFIMIAMIAISILLLIIVAFINISNTFFVHRQVYDTLTLLTITEGNYIEIGNHNDEGNVFSFYIPKDNLDIYLSSNFFSVKYDRFNNVSYADVSRIQSIDTKRAIEIANRNFTNENTTGRYGRFVYSYTNSGFTNETTAIYLDISDEISSIIRVFVVTLSIAIIGFLGMLVIVILLSKKMIKPIAENYDLQKEFITNAGHELKTPLAIIQSNAEALEIFNGENKYSTNIKNQVIRLNGLMNNLLELAKMSETSSQYKIEEFDLSKILNEAIDSFEENFNLKNIQVIKEIDDGVKYKGDIETIRKLLLIFIDNAQKYTDEFGQFKVELNKSKKVNIIFKNTTKAITKDDVDRLFERFYRSDKSHNQTGGYGIGLAIAKRIIEVHNGTISVNLNNGELSFNIELR